MKLPAVFERHRTAIDGELRMALAAHASPMYDMLRYHLGWVNAEGQPLQGPCGKALRPTLCLLACASMGADPRVALHRGGILNVASVAGFLPGPGMSVYYASKAFVLSFTEALHHELADRGIRVTALCPGPVPTGFQARAGIRPMRAASLLEVSAEKVARAGYAGLMAGKRLVVPGWGNKAVTLLPRLLPRGLVLRLTDARKRQRPAGPRWPRER